MGSKSELISSVHNQLAAIGKSPDAAVTIVAQKTDGTRVSRGFANSAMLEQWLSTYEANGAEVARVL